MVNVLKKLTMGLGVTLLFFLLIELILLAVGVKPLYERKDPYVGFSGYAPLYVKSTSSEGNQIYKTAFNKIGWFNPQQFPVIKTEGTFRIFCVGGSTTYGRPYNDLTSFPGWLREFLPAIAPNRNWEIINAGGISYASYRVARLMEELIDYEPDLFIIYSGHNEFLEKRTYDKLLNTPEIVLNLAALASRMRLYSAMYDISYDRNSVLSTEVNAILDGSIGPEEYHRDDDMRTAVLKHYNISLRRMTHIAKRVGAKLILVTPASNIKDFSPFKTEAGSHVTKMNLDKINTHKLEAEQAVTNDNFAKALKLCNQALSLDARNADILYLKARSLHGLGRVQEAREAFIEARDEDVCPLRALTPVRAIVSKVAKEQNTGFVDFVSIVNRNSPDGIPGSELFLDHVHPTITGNRMLALALLEEMKEMEIIPNTATLDIATTSDITAKVQGNLDEVAHAEALKNLSSVLMWAGKNEEAERLVSLAVSKTSEDGESHFQKAVLFRRAGNDKAALFHFKEAARLSPSNPAVLNAYGVILSDMGHKTEARKVLEKATVLNPKRPGIFYDLGVILESLGKLRQAETAYKKVLKLAPNHADAYNNLGVIYAKRGDIRAAYKQFTKAVHINPEHANATNNLARAKLVLNDNK